MRANLLDGPAHSPTEVTNELQRLYRPLNRLAQ
jgi:hypothetical protein